MGSSPRAPATPDPNVTSAAQTQSNIQTAAYNNALEHGNTTTPLGSQTFTGRVDPTTGAMVYDQNITLSPDQQKIFDQEQQQNIALNNTAQGMLGTVGQTYASPLDTSNIRDTQYVGAPGTFNWNAGQADTFNVNGPGIQSSIDTSNLNGLMDQSGILGQLDNSNLSSLFGANDLMGARQQVQDALYNQQSQYLDPRYSNYEQQLNTDLANKGVVEGSEAWRNARDQFARERMADYSNARNSAITGSGAEMANLANIALSNRNALFNENLQSGAFQNAAQAQAAGQAAANRGQLFGENAAQGQFNNSAQEQAYNQALSAAGFGNQARLTNADFANQAIGNNNSAALSNAGFNNSAASQALQQALAQRALPLNEFNALRNSSQVDIPQFANAGNAQVAPTDSSGNVWNAYQGQQGIYNQQVGTQNANTAAGASLASAALLALAL